ncbi:MAG: DUF4430 domain-containing protein [Oscillospiraceae bacterium]|nr:DUF4430 domain-containing protein [Oscillospiraceae bacterium]
MKNKKIFLSLIVVVAVVSVLIFAYKTYAPAAAQGSKNITIEVINSAQESTVYNVSTEAEYLEEAFADAEGLVVESVEGQYGIMMKAVNGEEAVWEVNNAYWSITVNGEYGMYGASEQVVNDGDVFQLVYTIG